MRAFASIVNSLKAPRMATRTLKAQAPLLDDRIDILKRDAAKYPQAKQIFETAGAILALVQVSTLGLRPPFDSHTVSMARSGKDRCPRRVRATL